MALVKPSCLQTALSYLNLYKGQWVDWWIVVVPPFSFTPGEWIEKAIDWVITFLNFFAYMIEFVWDEAIDALAKAKEALGKIVDWIAGAPKWFWGQITDWWKGVWEDVKTWVKAFVDLLWSVLKPIADWYGNINYWWNSKIKDVCIWVTNLLAEIPTLDTLKSYFTPFKAVLDFWGIFSQGIVAFFSNPLEYIWESVIYPSLDNFLTGFKKGMEKKDD